MDKPFYSSAIGNQSQLQASSYRQYIDPPQQQFSAIPQQQFSAISQQQPQQHQQPQTTVVQPQSVTASTRGQGESNVLQQQLLLQQQQQQQIQYLQSQLMYNQQAQLQSQQSQIAQINAQQQLQQQQPQQQQQWTVIPDITYLPPPHETVQHDVIVQQVSPELSPVPVPDQLPQSPTNTEQDLQLPETKPQKLQKLQKRPRDCIALDDIDNSKLLKKRKQQRGKTESSNTGSHKSCVTTTSGSSLVTAPTTTTTTVSSSAPLSTGNIVAISVGTIVGALVLVGLVFAILIFKQLQLRQRNAVSITPAQQYTITNDLQRNNGLDDETFLQAAEM